VSRDPTNHDGHAHVSILNEPAEPPPLIDQPAIAVLSLLHEAAFDCSAVRRFRGEPVIAWTLHRLSRCNSIGDVAIVCWDDQVDAIRGPAEHFDCHVLVKTPRTTLPAIEAVAAAQRWADGWRGGLLGTCCFDRGFHAPFVRELLGELEYDVAVLVDPSAALVDPALIDALVARANELPEYELVFAQAAPGLAGAAVRRSMVEKLAVQSAHPGRALHYQPKVPQHDPITTKAAIAVPTRVARTAARFTMDSDRQISRLNTATASLNGTLASTAAEQLVHRIEASPPTDALPREIVLELTTRRRTTPLYSPLARGPVDRPDMAADVARKVIDEAARADDVRLTFAGVGDPLLHPELLPILQHARRAGVQAIAVETDLQCDNDVVLSALGRTGLADVISVMLPAMSAGTYTAVMGDCSIREPLEAMRRLLAHRAEAKRGVPIVVPTFVKCHANFVEMEAWYDQWLNALGTAVIRGPTACGGLVDVDAIGLADMSPPRRQPCVRLESRVVVLSDGRVVPCEEDVLGRQTLGDASKQSLDEIWQQPQRALRDHHRDGRWLSLPVCGGCREWHRP
jgi:radical SAM protein with 4Fe4S-binding SPASM domain